MIITENLRELNNIENIKSVFCIDYGLKKVGIAISPDMKLSLPIKTIYENNAQKQLEIIKDEIKKYNPSILVIGLPINMDGTSGEQSLVVKSFAEKLDTKIQIYLQDERVTSIASEKLMRNIGFSRAQIAKYDDSMSASMILESFLRNFGNLLCVKAEEISDEQEDL